MNPLHSPKHKQKEGTDNRGPYCKNNMSSKASVSSSSSLLVSIPNSIAMLVLSLVRKLLWTFRYPSFAPESGPYRVGAIQTRVGSGASVQCQIHYPTTDDNKSQKPSFYPYFRPKAVTGLADYSGTDSSLLSILSNRDHPCLINANPAMTTEEEGKFPLVLFSHGLGGCMEMYTQLCQQIASYGYCVVAMEHQDGSGAYAEDISGRPIYYKRPDDTPYSRQKVLNFRRPFLKERVDETTKLLKCIFNDKINSNKEKYDTQLQKVLASVDTSSGKVALVGHSFGGATMVLAAQQFLKEKQEEQSSRDKIQIQPTSLTVLDPWAFSLEDSALNEGVDGIPTLSVLSQSWLTNPETKQVDQLLSNCPELTASLYAPDSVHASVADSVSWLPGFVLRRLGLRGKGEKKFVTFEAAAKVCVQNIRTGKIKDVGELREYKFKRTIPATTTKVKEQAPEKTSVRRGATPVAAE